MKVDRAGDLYAFVKLDTGSCDVDFGNHISRGSIMSVVQIINRNGGTHSDPATTLKIENLSSQVNGSNINFSTSRPVWQRIVFKSITMECYRYKAARMTTQKTTIGGVLLLRLLLKLAKSL